MLTYIRNKVDPTCNQKLRVYADVYSDSDSEEDEDSYIMIKFPKFRYYFEIASGDKALWMMLYIANKLGLLPYKTKISQYNADSLKGFIMREFRRRNGGTLFEGDKFWI
jgi:hypothetical protein